MSFLDTIHRAKAYLEEHGRVSLRALKREFDLDDDGLEALVEELVEVQAAAVREGKVLVWVGPLVSQSPGPKPPGQKRDPTEYTPKHLADKILQSKSAVEGERKQVTVLFADIKGSMEMAGGLDPEEWHGILDRFFEIANEGVHRFEGTVNQYTGDGIMALFGAPIAHEDHAQRACYAALHLRDALRGYADELRLERGLNLSTRIGLNSGEVVVGKIGDDLRMDYTAQGQVVNVAQRMEQLAESGRVYMAQQTADSVAGYFRLREIGPTQVKGLRDPVRVYDLDAVGEFQGRFDVSRARGLTRFVGREHEMAVLEAALERAARGEGRLVGIVAEAGTGKSRLTYEFGERCRARGLRIISASCPPHGQAIPLAFHMNAARSEFGVSESDDAETARNKIAGFMTRVDPALAVDIPFMLDFLGLAQGASDGVPLDPEVTQREFLRIVKRVIERRDRLGMLPAIGLLEDLHWIDPASQALNVEINRFESERPALTVMNFRPEYRPPEADWPNYEEIRLKPLTAESTAEFLRDLLGPDASVQRLERLIQERAAGNPFFVEEIVHSLAESGNLQGTRGAYCLARPVDEIDVPDSVQAVLAARIDRLDELAKRILQSAAVVGSEFPVALLERVVEVPRRNLDEALHALAAADLVYQLAAYPEVEYSFKHPLTQAVAYDTQLKEPRRRVHAGIARALEQLHEDALDEKSGLIAYHWENAGEAWMASTWHDRTARWCRTRDLAGALRHWQYAWKFLQGLAPSGSIDTLRLHVCSELVNSQFLHGGSLAELRALYDDGCAVAERLGDKASLALLSIRYLTSAVVGGKRIRELGRLASETLRLSREIDDVEVRVHVLTTFSGSYRITGTTREGLGLADEGLRLARGDIRLGADRFDFCPVVDLESSRAELLSIIGRYEEASDQLTRALEHAAAIAARYPETLISVYAADADLARRSGRDVSGALVRARHGVVAANTRGTPRSLVGAHRTLALANLLNEHWDEAIEAGRYAESVGPDRLVVPWRGDSLATLAEAYLGAGDVERARETADQAVAHCIEYETHVFETRCRVVQAHAHLASGDAAALTSVETTLQAALRLIDQIGAMSEEPFARVELAELARRRGDEAAHDHELKEAHRLFSEMGATAHAERLEQKVAS